MNKSSGNILLFYSEMAAYFLACAETLHLNHGYQVHVVHWPINPEAPFAFREYKGVHLYPKDQYSVEGLYDLYKSLDPELVFTIGWMDPEYKALAKRMKRDGKFVVAGMDNRWKGNARQQLAILASPFYLKPFFTHIWIPGDPQYKFASKLGFPDKNILRGFYSADIAPFHKAFHKFKEQKSSEYPHNFLYVGRFLELKGLDILIDAFSELREEINHDWTMTLIGNGPMREKLEGREAVKFMDFVQPNELPELAINSGCFVFPSTGDNWGVVLHEFAGAGLPLISSLRSGATTAFVKDGENGYRFGAHTTAEIKEALRKVIMHTDEELNEMSHKSHEISKQISPDTWSETLLSVIA
ncbi:MAG: glycosyltransferase family 4 protein [Bacteroidota bacterium]